MKAGSKVFTAIAPAMFDPEAFPNPKKFDIHRTTPYLHFGYGYHRCYGRHINGVVIPELVAAFLRLTNLRRAKGVMGHSGLK